MELISQFSGERINHFCLQVKTLSSGMKAPIIVAHNNHRFRIQMVVQQGFPLVRSLRTCYNISQSQLVIQGCQME